MDKGIDSSLELSFYNGLLLKEDFVCSLLTPVTQERWVWESDIWLFGSASPYLFATKRFSVINKGIDM